MPIRPDSPLPEHLTLNDVAAEDTWQPFVPRADRLRIADTSCCGAYELASEGGQYFVLKPEGDGHMETGRGTHAHAAGIFTRLAAHHRCARPSAPAAS
jgi:hypothetical protein